MSAGPRRAGRVVTSSPCAGYVVTRRRIPDEPVVVRAPVWRVYPKNEIGLTAANGRFLVTFHDGRTVSANTGRVVVVSRTVRRLGAAPANVRKYWPSGTIGGQPPGTIDSRGTSDE